MGFNFQETVGDLEKSIFEAVQTIFERIELYESTEGQAKLEFVSSSIPTLQLVLRVNGEKKSGYLRRYLKPESRYKNELN